MDYSFMNLDLTDDDRNRLIDYLSESIMYNVSPPGDGYCGRSCIELRVGRRIPNENFIRYDSTAVDNFTTIQLANVCRDLGLGFAFTRNDNSTEDSLFNFNELSIMNYNNNFDNMVVLNLYHNHYTLFLDREYLSAESQLLAIQVNIQKRDIDDIINREEVKLNDEPANKAENTDWDLGFKEVLDWSDIPDKSELRGKPDMYKMYYPDDPMTDDESTDNKIGKQDDKTEELFEEFNKSVKEKFDNRKKSKSAWADVKTASTEDDYDNMKYKDMPIIGQDATQPVINSNDNRDEIPKVRTAWKRNLEVLKNDVNDEKLYKDMPILGYGKKKQNTNKYRPNTKKWKPLRLFDDDRTDYSEMIQVQGEFLKYQEGFVRSERPEITMPYYNNITSYEGLFRKISKYTRDNVNETGIMSFYLKFRSQIFQLIFLECLYGVIILSTDFKFPTIDGNVISNKTPDFIGNWQGKDSIMEFTISNKTLTALTNKQKDGVLKYENEAKQLNYNLYHIQLILEEEFSFFVNKSKKMLNIYDNSLNKLHNFYKICQTDKSFVIDNYDDVTPVRLPEHVLDAKYSYSTEMKRLPVFEYKNITGKLFNYVMDRYDNICLKLDRMGKFNSDKNNKKKIKYAKTKYFIIVNMKNDCINLVETSQGYTINHIKNTISYNKEFIFQFIRKNPKYPLEFEDGIPVKYRLIKKDGRKLCSDDYYLDYINQDKYDKNILSNYKSKNIMNDNKMKDISSIIENKMNEKQSELEFKLKNSFKQPLVDIDNVISGDVKNTRDTCMYFKRCCSDSLVDAIIHQFCDNRILTHLEIKEDHKDKFVELNEKLKHSTLEYNLLVKSISTEHKMDFKTLVKNHDKFIKKDGVFQLDFTEGMKDKTVQLDEKLYDKLCDFKAKRDKKSNNLKEYKKKYSDVVKDNAVKIKNNYKDPNSIVNVSFSSWKRKNIGKRFEGWGNNFIDIDRYRHKLKSYYKDLLQECQSPNLETLPIDTNQYTDIKEINHVKRDMINSNIVLKKFTEYTKLSCSLQFNQKLFKVLYMHSLKSNKTESYYVDNLGYKNVLLLIRGGKSGLQTQCTKAYRLIYPINETITDIMFGMHRVDKSSCETFTKDNVTYIVTPWTTQNINLCKTFMSSGFQYALSTTTLVQRMINDSDSMYDFDTIIANNYLPYFLINHNYRQTEAFLHNMRYILFNMLSTYSDFGSLLPDIIFYNSNPFQCFIQQCVLGQITNIYNQLNRINNVNFKLNDLCKNIQINNVFTGVKINDVTAFSEMFYTSFIMRKGYYFKKAEQKTNLVSVLNSVLGTDDRLKNMPENLNDEEKDSYYKFIMLNDNINGQYRKGDIDHVGKHTLFYSSKVIANSAQILQGLLLNKNNRDYYQNTFNKVILNELDAMANSNGLRGDGSHSDFFGAKGYDVVYTRLLEILKDRFNLEQIDSKSLLNKYEENPEMFSYTFLECIEDNKLDEAILHQVEKEQRNLGREIYVLNFKTKIYQQIIEKYLAKICNQVDNEVISIPSSDRQSFIHRKFIMSEAEYKDYETFTNCSLDCRKWAAMSNNYKYVDFINNMEDVFPRTFINLFNYFFNVYTTNKKVYTREYVIKDMLNDENRNSITKLLIKDKKAANDAYYFYMPHSFMMGIFNYLSSLCHAANQSLASRTLTLYNRARNTHVHMIAIAHSDDSMMRLFSNKSDNTHINKNLEIYEHCLKCCNHLLSPKKCNTNIYNVKKQTGSNYLEFLSILYIKGELIPMIPKFSANLEYNATDSGYSSDMSTSVSKTIELLSNGATFQEAYIAMKVVSSSIMYFYNLINKDKLNDKDHTRMRDLPYYFMGSMDCHPIFYIMMGSDAELIRYLLADSNKLNNIISALCKLNIQMDVNDSGIGLNWNFKHYTNLKIKKKIESMPAIDDEKLSWILSNVKAPNKSLLNVLWYSNMLSNRNFANSITQENDMIKMNRVFTSINQKCINTLSGMYTPNEFMYMIDDYLHNKDLDETIIHKMGLDDDYRNKNFYDTLLNIIDLIYKKEKMFYSTWATKLKSMHLQTKHIVTLKPSVITVRSKNLSVPIWFNAIDFVILNRLKEFDYLVDNKEQKYNVSHTINNFFLLSNFNSNDLNLNQLKYAVQKILTKNNKQYKIYTTRDSGNKYVHDSTQLVEWLQVNTFHHRKIHYKPFVQKVFNYSDKDWELRQTTYELCLTYKYASDLAEQNGFSLAYDTEIYKPNVLKAKNLTEVLESITKFGLSYSEGMVYDHNCYVVWLKEQKRFGQNWIGSGEAYVKHDDFDMIVRFAEHGIFSVTSNIGDSYIFPTKLKDLMTTSLLYNNQSTSPSNLEYTNDEGLYFGCDRNKNLCIDYKSGLESIYSRVYRQDYYQWDLDTLHIDDKFKYNIIGDGRDYKVNFPYESNIERRYVLANYLKLIEEFKSNEFLKQILDDNDNVQLTVKEPMDYYTRANGTLLYKTLVADQGIKVDESSFYLKYLEASEQNGRNDLRVKDLTDNISRVGGLKYMMPDALYKTMLKKTNDDTKGQDTRLYSEYVSARDYKLTNSNNVRDMIKINGFKLFFPKQCWLDIFNKGVNDNYKPDFYKVMISAMVHFNDMVMLLDNNRLYMYIYYIFHMQFVRNTGMTEMLTQISQDMTTIFETVGEEEFESYLIDNNFPTSYRNTFNISGVMQTATLVDYFIDSVATSSVRNYGSERASLMIKHNEGIFGAVYRLNGISFDNNFHIMLCDIVDRMFGYRKFAIGDNTVNNFEFEVHELTRFTVNDPENVIDVLENLNMEGSSEGMDDVDLLLESIELEEDEITFGDTGDRRIYSQVQFGERAHKQLAYMQLRYNNFLLLTDNVIDITDCKSEIESRMVFNDGPMKGLYVYYRVDGISDLDNKLKLKGYCKITKKTKRITIPTLVDHYHYPHEESEFNSLDLQEWHDILHERLIAYNTMVRNQNTNMMKLETLLLDKDVELGSLFSSINGMTSENSTRYQEEFKKIKETLLGKDKMHGSMNNDNKYISMEDCISLLQDMSADSLIGLLEGTLSDTTKTHEAIKQSKHLHVFSENNNIILDPDSILELEGFCDGLRDLLFKDGFYLTIADRKNLKSRIREMMVVLKNYRKNDDNELDGKYHHQITGLMASIQILNNLISISSEKQNVGVYAFDKIDDTTNKINQCVTKIGAAVTEEMDKNDDPLYEEDLFSINYYELRKK